MGPLPRSLTAEANSCFMVRVLHGPNRIQGCGASIAPERGLPSDQLYRTSNNEGHRVAVTLDTKVLIQGVKTRSGKGGAESFSQLPSSESSCQHKTDSYFDEIEMEVLHGSWPSEFSHSLGQNRKSSTRANVFRCSPNNGHRQDTSACPFRADCVEKLGVEADRDR